MSAKSKFGWAEREITPDRPVSLRGLFNLRIATEVRDPLTLTALAIETGGEQTIIVSMDACAVNEEVLEAVRTSLGERLPELDPQKLIASATHTHTAPYSGGGPGREKEEELFEAIVAKYPDYMSIAEYTDLVVEAMVSAVCEAWQTREEGFLGWGYSYAVIGENRRVRYFDGHAEMYGSTSDPGFSHIEGHVDHGVNLLFTWDRDQRLTGIVVNLACPSQASEGGQTFISADFWHDTRAEIRRRFGESVRILPQCSAAGDQTPHRMIDTRAEERMMMLKYGEGLSKQSNAGLRKDIARRIADAVEDAEPAARKDLHAGVEHHHSLKVLQLPHWDVTDEEYETAQRERVEYCALLQEMEAPDALDREYTSTRTRISRCDRVIERYEQPLESVPVEMSVVRLGEIAFVTAPFEYYLDFGDRIKGRSEALQTFVVQLAGGGTYLATERAAAGSSYGAVPASCRVCPEGGQVIVDEAVATISEMFAE